MQVSNQRFVTGGLGETARAGRVLDAPGPLDAPIVCDGAWPELVGHSEAVAALRRTLANVARRRCTVLIHGETGTGKEMVARQLHGVARHGPFVAVDCSALSDTLFESQMFGHAKGAFTGATRDSVGFVRAADKGTLFLDEIGELSLGHQAKLLRVLQERQVTPVGESRPVAVDVRIACATHRDLDAMVREGRFREDLYFRLAVVSVTVPPLRRRPGDVRALAEHFLRVQARLYDEETKTISPAALAVLDAHAWPGNVRELANAIEHAHVMAGGSEIAPDDLPARILSAAALQDRAPREAPALCLATVERRAIREALHRTAGNKSAACRLLGINVQRLNRRLDKLGIAGDVPTVAR